MKRIKKLASLLLAMVMVLSMGLTVFAGSMETPDPDAKDGEQQPAQQTTAYELFQIFVGDFSADGKLSNVKWGINGTGYNAAAKDALVSDTELAKLSAVADSTDDLAKLNVIKTFANLNSTAIRGLDAQPEYVNGKYRYESLASGYYLIRGKVNNTDGTNEAYTLYVVQVIGDGAENEGGVTQDSGNGVLEFEPKRTGVPTPDKKVKDVDDTTGTTSDWQDSADHDINDVIDYQLSATLPDAESLAAYEAYKLVFKDELSKGLDYVYEGDLASGLTVKVGDTVLTSGYTVAYDGPVGEATSDAVRHLTITFNDVKAAPVNATGGAVITIEYQARLNAQAVIGQDGNDNTLTLEYSNDPNNSASGNPNPPTGTTPPTTAIVFTFKTVVNKVDQDKNPLTGAAFALEKYMNDTWISIKEFEMDDATTQFSFNGLDDGRYRLTETATPAGYNSIDPIYFVIVATHSADDGTSTALTGLEVYQTNEAGEKTNDTEAVAKFTVTLTNGTATTDIENRSGSLLPSTGGIGTTIFYVVGGILVVAAGILLVTKKRMSAR